MSFVSTNRVSKGLRNCKSGFTLVEIMLVVVIIGLIAAVVMPKITGQSNKAKIAACRASIAGLKTAVNLYEMDVGTYPSTLQALVTKGGEEGWKGPYVEKGTIPKDPWNHDFIYSTRDEGFDIKAKAPDGTDITN